MSLQCQTDGNSQHTVHTTECGGTQIFVLGTVSQVTLQAKLLGSQSGTGSKYLWSHHGAVWITQLHLPNVPHSSN